MPWGHPILTPEGDEIRLPHFAFDQLRTMGLINRQRGRDGLKQISSRIYAFMDADCASLMDGLQAVLGQEMTGPKLLICECRECYERMEELDKTEQPEGPKKGRYWLKIIRTPVSELTI